jgi:hypothetical protein
MASVVAVAAVAGTSFALSWACYYCSRAASAWLFEAYRAMAADEKAAWDTRIVSSVHAVLLFVGAAWSLVQAAAGAAEAGHEATFVRGANLLMELCMAMSLGYFAQDLTVILWVRGALWSLPDVVHHIVAVAVLLVCLSTQTFLFYVTWAMLGELSTPWLNARWLLAKLGRAVPAVDAVFVATFFPSRPVSMLLNLAHALAHYRSWSHLAVAHVQLGFGVVFAALQFYWAYLIVLAIRDTLTAARPKHA